MNVKYANVRLRLVAGEARNSPPITTILAPFGLNLVNFCEQFNKLSKDLIDEAIELELKVKINIKTKQFEILIKGVSLNHLVDILLDSKDNIELLDVYKIYLIQRKFFQISEKSQFKNILSFLNTYGIRNLNS